MSSSLPHHLASERTRLALGSALAVMLLCARVYWTGTNDYVFLTWNLFLAWVPWAIARVSVRMHRRKVSALAIAPVLVAYVAFLPNAPYLVTDFMHLRAREDAPLWFDAIMLMSFAWAGVSLGVASLRAWAEIAEERAGARASLAFVIASCVLTGFGIYLGRFGRLNSWDVIAKPLSVLASAVEPIAHPQTHLRAWTFTPIFAVFFFTSYLATARSARRTSHAEAELT